MTRAVVLDETSVESGDFQTMQVSPDDGVAARNVAPNAIITDSLMNHHHTSPRYHHQRSIKEMPEVILELREYFTSVELLMCFLSLFLGELLPRLFVSHIQKWDGRVLPYQKTAAGDVLIQLDLNNEVVDEETFPFAWLIVTCGVMPLIMLSVIGVWSGPRRDGLSIACSLLLALGAMEFVTNMIKFYCGYFRPNFYHMCDWDAENAQCNDEVGEFRARKSFPSGHAATSFCAMTIVTLWLLGNLQFRWRRPLSYAKRRLRYVAASLPMLFAFFVASSRVHDTYHHPADVMTGALIGYGCASWSYGMWYPSIHHPCAGVPLETLEEEEEAQQQHTS